MQLLIDIIKPFLVIAVLLFIGSCSGSKLTEGRVGATVANFDEAIEIVINDLEHDKSDQALQKLRLIQKRQFELANRDKSESFIRELRELPGSAINPEGINNEQ